MLQQEASLFYNREHLRKEDCKIICKEIRIQIEFYSANTQLHVDSLNSERDLMQAREEDLMIVNKLHHIEK